MGAELSCPHPGGRGVGGQRTEGQPEAWLPGPPETRQVGGCLRSHGASVGLSASGAWLCPPGHVRAEEWAACVTSEVGVLAHGLLPTPLSPKSQLGAALPKKPPLSLGISREAGSSRVSAAVEAGVCGDGGGGLIQGDRRLGPQGLSCRAPAWRPPRHP